MKTRMLSCVFSILFFLLNSSNIDAQLQKIYLHPKAAGTEKQSTIVDSIRIIPLEIKEGIDLGKLNYITVTSNYFLIVDYPEKIILVYARNGSFVKKINYKSLSDGMYPGYDEHTNQIIFFGDNRNYTLTSKDRVKIMLDWSNPRNKKYFKKYIIDLSDTTFAIQKGSPTENDVLRAFHYYDDYYWRGQIKTSSLFKDSLDYELKIYKGNKLVKGYFPYNRVNEPRFLFTEESAILRKTDSDNEHLLTRPFCDTIYRLSKESISPAYQLVLPLENTLPSSFYTQAFKNKTERDNFRRNNGWMFHQINSFYETPRFILFGVGYLSNFEMYLYLKQSQTTYKAKNIRSDSSHYNLALFQDYNLQKVGDRFYKSAKAGDLLQFFEEHKTATIPEELEKFLASNPSSTAPVIVEFKLKN